MGDARPRLIVLLAAKIILLLYFVLSTNTLVVRRLAFIGLRPALVVFAALWLISLTALLVVAFSPSRTTRIVWTVLIAAATLSGHAFEAISRTYFGYADFETLVNVAAFAGDATATYGRFIVSAALNTLAGVLAIQLPPHWPVPAAGRHRIARWAWCAPLVPVSLVCAILYLRGGMGSDGLPQQFNALAFGSVWLALRAIEEPPGPRDTVTLPLAAPGSLKDLVVIIDESIRGDYLDINAAGGVPSGLMDVPGAVNFGIASAAANCSGYGNVSLRYGLTRRNYRTDLHTRPALWAYARKAGYRTVYLDGQRHNGSLQNFMTAQELEEVDEFIQLPDTVPAADKDITIARLMRRIMRRPGRHFILVNKSGMHFPYEGKYPPALARYSPHMQRDYFGTESDPESLNAASVRSAETALERTKFVNSYRNGVAWNVGGFFGELLPALDLSRAALFYTADHGQDFHEDGRPGWSTHCNSGNVAPGEGMVPFVVITAEPGLSARLRASAAMNRNLVSLFNMAPSVLVLLGYSEERMRASGQFERTIFEDLTGNDQRFVSAFLARFGRQPVWHPIR